MNNLFAFLKSIEPRIDKVFEHPIWDDKNEIVGWSSVIRDDAGYPYSGGTDNEREFARLKALYEGIERSVIKSLFGRGGQSFFLLDRFPTSNGFACGPSEDFVIQKAIFEGFERYLWDLWVDRKICLSSIFKYTLSDYALVLADDFDDINFYGCQFIPNFYSQETPLSFLVCVGKFKNGIFWGSQVSAATSSLSFDHALVEANRNLKSFRSGTCKSSESYEDQVLQKFGESGLSTFSPYVGSSDILHIHGEFEILQSAEVTTDVWIARSLIKGFQERKDISRMSFW